MHKKEISAEVPDWSREKKLGFSWNPSRSLIRCVRVYQHQVSSRYWFVRQLSKLTVVRYRFWTIVTGADIPLNCKVEGGLKVPHPNGVVIHPDAKIGPNCLIFQQVTIGITHGKGPPKIGGNVDIGAGAKILGDIYIGDHARIGANAVVLSDIESGATAVGVPARVINIK